MMGKYDSRLVYNYIMGQPIEGYDILELENDIDFMTRVIDITNDKKMYRFCSEELKQNFDFVKYLMNKFSDDVNFVMLVAHNALKDWLKKNQEKAIEIRILLSKYTKGINDGLPSQSRALLESFYLKKRLLYDESIAKSKYHNAKEVYGMGYIIVLNDYGDSELIRNYFAMRMLVDIFKMREGFNLEKLLHDNFKNEDEVIKFGINNFLLKYIARFDQSLSGYLTVHINLLKELREYSFKCLDYWKVYEEEQEEAKTTAILEEVLNFYKEYYEGIDVYEELLEYIANEFNLMESFMKYDIYFKYCIENKDTDIEFKCLEKLQVDKLPFYTRRKLDALKNKIVGILNDKNEEIKREIHQCEIIKVDFGKKKHKH